jgi:hypothetical protein
MASPHAFRVNASVSPAAERTSESGLFSFRPAFQATVLQILFLGWAPASGRFELLRVGYRTGVGVVHGDEVGGIKEPFWVHCQECVRKAFRMKMCIREGLEWRVNEECVGVGG